MAYVYPILILLGVVVVVFIFMVITYFLASLLDENTFWTTHVRPRLNQFWDISAIVSMITIIVVLVVGFYLKLLQYFL